MSSDTKYEVKRTTHVVIDGKVGTFYGQHSKANGTQEGQGVFLSEEILILGGFDAGKFSLDEKSIVFNRVTC